MDKEKTAVNHHDPFLPELSELRKACGCLKTQACSFDFPTLSVNTKEEYCIHCCNPANCLACKDEFVNRAVIYLYGQWHNNGMLMSVASLEQFRKECWENAEGLWKARFS